MSEIPVEPGSRIEPLIRRISEAVASEEREHRERENELRSQLDYVLQDNVLLKRQLTELQQSIQRRVEEVRHEAVAEIQGALHRATSQLEAAWANIAYAENERTALEAERDALKARLEYVHISLDNLLSTSKTADTPGDTHGRS